MATVEERNAERLKQSKKYQMAWAKIKAKGTCNHLFGIFKKLGVVDPQKEREFMKGGEKIAWDGPLRQVRRNLKEIVLEREPTVDVDDLLRKVGVEKVDRVNSCIKAAIFNGHLQLQGSPDELHKTFWKFPCPQGCRKQIKVSLAEALEQRERGDSWGDDGYCASCEDCGCGYFLSNVCQGKPSLKDGKFHNHCSQCPNYGVCIFDYRNGHCDFCHLHYFRGNHGFACEGCGRESNGVMAKDGIGGHDPFGYQRQENLYFQSNGDSDEDEDEDYYDSEERQAKLDKVILAEDFETPEYQAMFDALGSDKEDEEEDEDYYGGRDQDMDEDDEDESDDDED